MNTLYLDLFSGISGDMFLGALLDLGVNFQSLQRELAKLKLDGYHLHAARKLKGKIEGVKFDMHVKAEHAHAHAHSHEGHGHGHHHHDHPHEHAHAHTHHHDDPHVHSHAHEHAHVHAEHHHRTYADIRKMIESSPLSDWVKHKAIAIFHRVALAEGKIHGQPPESVHFHEVGAIDSIVDIVGACIGLEILGKPRVLASHVTEGTGWVNCAHGRLPVPVPATLEILSARGTPISQCDEPHELVTPTGAALLAELVEQFGPIRNLVINKTGYGLGTRDNKTRPNVLRVMLGEEQVQTHDWETDQVAIVQTNLDDINAEILGRVMQRALDLGAMDAYHTPIQMKKNRPGVLFTILCAEGAADQFAELVLRETTAFGVRVLGAERRKLKREFTSVSTPHGPVSVKIGKLDGQVLQAAPEFESCRKLADETGIPLKQIYEAALRATRV